MSDTDYRIWCILEGNDGVPFSVNASSTTTIDQIKILIKEWLGHSLAGRDSTSLILWKPLVPIPVKPSYTLAKRLRDRGPDPSTFAERLDPSDSVGEVFPNRNQTSPSPQLDVIIRLPGHMGSPTLVGETGAMQKIPRAGDLQLYEGIFVKVGEWGKYKRSDLRRNDILAAQDQDITAPDFVTAFEQMLERKPRLSVDDLALSQFKFSSYFEPSNTIADEGTRDANQAEQAHTACVVSFAFENRWKGATPQRPLKEPLTNSIFFEMFGLAPMNRTVATLKNQDCPIYVIVECPSVPLDELRQCQPRSDFLVSISGLPRLLVEVNSAPANDWPNDLVWMLTTGAFIVRFANQFLNAFQEHNFVLCAVYIWGDGNATRYTLFQKDNHRVFYNTKNISLNQPCGRVEFIRLFYSLLSVNSDEEGNTSTAIADLNHKVRKANLESMHTEEATENKGRKCAHTAGDGSEGGSGRAGGGSGTDDTRLRAHGYKVRQQDIVDDLGNVMELLYKMPDNLRIVYRPSNPDEEFVAKKIRKRSNELDIFRYLGTIERKSDHVIELIDSFDEWVVLPKLTVVDRIRTDSKEIQRKIVQVCWGLIEGVGYLHGLCIAHRDIKPDNLVVDWDLCLKIIDFDIAMKVEDEDQQVDDQCGTKGWMAPEVENKSRHSPIRADRWACGHVLLWLLNEFKNEDKSLRALARHLTAYDPKQRPSLIGASSVTPPLFSDAGNGCSASKRKALQPSQDSTEDKGGNMEPPNTKKQKLHGVGIQAE